MELIDMSNTKTTCYIGIDPGKYGCIAVIHDGGIDFIDYSEHSLMRIRSIHEQYNIELCAIEKQQVMPKQGSVSGFTIGVGYGEYLGALKVLAVPHVVVAPKLWQKPYGLPKDRRERKLKVVDIAKRMYPTAEIQTTNKERTSGRADALMIAHYAMLFS
jgi:hypothetical protein